jgi:hypothetical protein
MSKAMTAGAALLFFVLIAIGLWDLFRNLNSLAVPIALILVLAGVFNIWGALNEVNRRRE